MGWLGLLYVVLAFGGETTPVMIWSGTAPSGSCKGNRVVLLTTGAIYVCPSTTWSAVGGGGGGSPGGVVNNLQKNDGAGGFAAYAGTGAAAAHKWVTALDANGAATWLQPDFSDLTGSATVAQGGTGNGTATDDAVLIGNGTTWQQFIIPNCPTSANALGYVQSTNSITCMGTLQAGKIDPNLSLATGLLKQTTGTGVLSIGASGTDFAPGTSGLSTGIVKSTTGTGALSIATSGTDYSAGTSGLSTGYVKSTTGTGALATQAVPIPVSDGGTGHTSALTQGGITWGSSTTAEASSAAGTSGRDFLLSGGTGAPTWARGDIVVALTQDRSTTSTTAATTTDLTWSIAASATSGFQCVLPTIGTATSLMRFAVSAPASATMVAFSYQSSTTSATAFGQQGQIAGQWASTCTNCTPAVTASVITTANTFLVNGVVRNGANAGSVTIFFAASTSGQTTTLKQGAFCSYWTL